jgi:hypothetical protein
VSPAERLAATPHTLARLIAVASEAELDAAAPGEWSARTLLAHFRDDEYLCMRVALERMLAEDAPSLRFLDGAEWEPGRNRSRDRKDILLADFALQRQASLNIIQGLSAADLERTGRNGEGEPFTLAGLLEAWAVHDTEHIAQLERALGLTLAEANERRDRIREDYA